MPTQTRCSFCPEVPPDRPMKRTVLLLVALMAALVFALETQASIYPTDLDIPYSPDNPPGPTFGEAEKQRQFEQGRQVRREILAAFNAGLPSYTIPPGDYRFGADWQATESSFVLQGLHRPENQPFRILGYGATFWFNLSEHSAPRAHRMVKLIDCEHISLEGIIIDSDPRGGMDTRIVEFDFDRNRILVEPLKGTLLMPGPPKSEGRFIPYKANGHHIPSLYRVDSGWGPGNVFYKELVRTPDGRYWLTLPNDKLLRTVRDEQWRKVYGPEGMLAAGDLLGLLHSTAVSIWLNECKQITIRDCRVYAVKACLSESGGYGDHRWIGCYFMARPGSNNLLGGDGTMNNACEHGSTFDGIVIQRTTDDAFNNHGYWQMAESATEQAITFKQDLPKQLAAGLKAEAYDARKKTFLATLTVASVNGRTVTFREPVGREYSASALLFPALQNAGWVIRNSFFVDCYQRLLFQCGPGVFENNRIERVGSSLDVASGPIGYVEGGLPDHVTIRGNVFIDSSICPPNPILTVRGVGRRIRHTRIENNIFCQSGRGAVAVSQAEGLVIKDNIVIAPFMSHELLPERKFPTLPAFTLEQIKGATVRDNIIIRPAAAPAAQTSESTEVDERDNQTRVSSVDPMVHRLRALIQKHDASAAAIISTLREELRTAK